MQIGNIQFKPRLWPTLVTILLFPVLIRLGFWQLDRAEEKREIQQQQQRLNKQGYTKINNASLFDSLFEYQKVEMIGNFVTDKVMFLDNKPYNGVHGYHVITPFRIDGTDSYVLVNRGWVAMPVRRDKLPGVETDDAVQTLTGMIKFPSSNFKLGDNMNDSNSWPQRIQWLEVDWVAKQTGLRLLPFVVLQDSKDGSRLVRDWKIIVSPPEKNISYAVQWFALALALLIIFLVVNSKK